jgi:hypothetical protein
VRRQGRQPATPLWIEYRYYSISIAARWGNRIAAALQEVEI